ncbi:hypothetical protein IM725_18820 [Ramlibacter aquaticus]|uniref:Uncharacterized protein n=2 Tax=Comamonadaceae TaxID=80864 RepID=A0ABR9SJY0_9BURK|nr:hypothetical protein [Ramlibacter aquaticus]
MKNSLRATSIAVLLLAAGSAFAANDASPEPDYTLTFNVGAVSDYRVRGIAQTSYQPAVQAGADFTHKSGVYLGTFVSNVKWVKEFNLATKGSYELDLYGGFRDAIDSTLSYDVGVITYQYPGNNSGAAGTPGAGLFANASTTEVYGSLTYKMFTLKYNRSVSNFLGNLDSKGSQYFDLSAAIDLGNGMTLTPHVGRQLIPHQALPASYSDIALTFAKDFGNGFVATAAAMDTDAKRSFYTDSNGRFLGRGTVVLGVKYTF